MCTACTDSTRPIPALNTLPAGTTTVPGCTGPEAIRTGWPETMVVGWPVATGAAATGVGRSGRLGSGVAQAPSTAAAAMERGSATFAMATSLWIVRLEASGVPPRAAGNAELRRESGGDGCAGDRARLRARG